MVNLWPGVPAKCLCDKHLNAVLAEYNDLLMPSMRKGNRIDNYIRHGCVDLPVVNERIVECLQEAKSRGHDWKYSVPSEANKQLIHEYVVKYSGDSELDVFGEARRKEMGEMNVRVLSFRCKKCRELLVDHVISNEWMVGVP